MSSLNDLLKRFVLEPIDDFFVGQQKIMQRFGVDEKVNHEIYKQTDHLLYESFKKMYNFEILNSENIPEDYRVIVCCNHQSLLDPLVFGVGTGHTSGRKLHIMAKVELFETPLVNAWVRTHFAFPVRRGSFDKVSYERAVELLNRDEMVGMFPEGTLNPGAGRFLEPKTGAARLAYETDSIILPMVIYGTDRIYGKGAKYPRTSGKMVVNFGKPMHYKDIFKGTPENPNFYKRASKRIMRKIRNLYWDTHELYSKSQN